MSDESHESQGQGDQSAAEPIVSAEPLDNAGLFPNVTREKIEQTCLEFDTSLRSQPTWSKWETKRQYRYAMQWNDRLYPAKEIVRLATGYDDGFYPHHAHAYLKERGFAIVSLRSESANPDSTDHKRAVAATNVIAMLTSSLISAGFHFTSWQIATFYTALQTKGFVILSGISGTGKTKLVQHFARLLPQPSGSDSTGAEVISIPIFPYMLNTNRIHIPDRFWPGLGVVELKEQKGVRLRFDGQEEAGKVARFSTQRANYVIDLSWQKPTATWLRKMFSKGDTLFLRPSWDGEGNLEGFDLFSSKEWEEQIPKSSVGENWLFLPVRPDWRDGKALLGYFNPLTGGYEWTPFLRFLLRAVQSYRNGDGLAWFVILDEMNLAHVEYYFADLLSVLESGRDDEGWTREALRPAFPEDAEGDLPPEKIFLPPNLHIVGTVNIDETTHAFSPKVLDRAFTLELTEADFTAYPPRATTVAAPLNDAARRSMLRHFTDDGKFLRVDKEIIADFVADIPAVRDRLQTLNVLLRAHHLHFGYRVFDEIVAFLAAAERNGLFDDLDDDAPLDAAVLMKVLPKFHGPRGKMETPLQVVLAWCVDLDQPPIDAVREQLRVVEPGGAASLPVGLTFRLPRTAERVRRMLWSLHTDGFAAFG